jgi:hypothetical protein
MPQSPNHNRVDTYGASAFAPDYSATILLAKMCTNHHEHFIKIKCLCVKQTLAHLFNNALTREILTEGERAVQLTSLYS